MPYLLRLLERGKFLTALSYLEGWKRGEVELEEEEILAAVKCEKAQVGFKAVEVLFERFPFERAKEIFRKLFGGRRQRTTADSADGLGQDRRQITDRSQGQADGPRCPRGRGA